MRENGRSLPTSSRRGLDVCVAASAVAAHSTTPSRLIRLRLSMKNVERFGKWLQDKRNFLKYSLVASGIPAAAISICVSGRDDGLLY